MIAIAIMVSTSLNWDRRISTIHKYKRSTMSLAQSQLYKVVSDVTITVAVAIAQYEGALANRCTLGNKLSRH